VSTDDLTWEPRWPRATAALACVAAAMLLVWPLLLGRTLFGGAGSDMLGAGYAFRLFGAEEFRATGSIPLWNPYLFGGMPFVAAMHGDVFYPTAWLRWVVPVDLAITWGMVLHFVLAGYTAYLLARTIGLSWTSAIVSGLAYQLSGIVASQVSPGHDGKLFVSALAPLAFMALWRAIHDSRTAWFGWFAAIVGLCVLSPHYQMTYFLLIGLGIWTLFLAFGPRADGGASRPAQAIMLAALAVVAGIGLASLQVLPFLEYVPFSPRATGGPNTGWGYVNLFAMPPEEIVSAVLPEFNGILDQYWGRNSFKLHTEYLGAFTVILASLAWGDRTGRRLRWCLAGIALLFMLLAFAGHTPFYRPWFELMPMMKKMRAMGMVFYLVALPVALLAGMGLERVLRRETPARAVALSTGILAGVALLGLVGVLQVFAEGVAIESRMAQVQANGAGLRLGAIRLLVVAVAAFGILRLVWQQKVRGGGAALLLGALVTADQWSIDRRFFDFSPRAESLFPDDEVVRAIRASQPPFRVFDLGEAYPSSTLMAYRVPSVLGYHGNELRYYDDLGQKARGWEALRSESLLDLLAVRFVILPDTATVPGWHRVAGPVVNGFGRTAVLLERDTVPPYARVVASVVAVPEDRVAPTVADPRFPVDLVALVPEGPASGANRTAPPFPASAISASVSEWGPGRMKVHLAGTAPDTSMLVISENWYPGWAALVDAAPGRVIRVNHALLGVILPPGSTDVVLRFESPAYERGRILSLVSLLVVLGMIVLLPRLGTGTPRHA